jgi:hypothetical protein
VNREESGGRSCVERKLESGELLEVTAHAM